MDDIFRESPMCRAFGHEFIRDDIVITEVGKRKVKIKHYKHCERCNITYVTNYGVCDRENLNHHRINFGSQEERIYKEYEKVKSCALP